MFSKTRTEKSTKNLSDKIKLLAEKIEWADAVIVGGGAGLSASAGFTYSGERFDEYFSDFKEKYGFSDIYLISFLSVLSIILSSVMNNSSFESERFGINSFFAFVQACSNESAYTEVKTGVSELESR